MCINISLFQSEVMVSGKTEMIGTYETFRRVVHKAELKPLLIEKALGQRTTQRVGRQSALLRKLQLREQVLKQDNVTRI